MDILQTLYCLVKSCRQESQNNFHQKSLTNFWTISKDYTNTEFIYVKYFLGISQQNTHKQSTIYAYSYLFFNFTIEPKHQNVYKAKLIFKLGKELSLTPESLTNVHTLVLYAEQGGKEVVLIKQPIRSISDTYKLDITKYIQNLVKKKSRHTRDVPSLEFSLRMAVFKNNKKITRLVEDTRDPPRILIQSYDERDAETRRSRRSASLRYCTGRNEENCCVRPLEINFKKDLGWDYIASPPSFNANYCDGSCPLNWHTENNLFYDILYKYATKNNRHIGPCCVPNEYESLNIIYFNDNNEPIVAKLPNVIVRSCSCR